MPKRYRRSYRRTTRRVRPRRFRRYGRIRYRRRYRRRRYARTLRIPTTLQNSILKKFKYYATYSTAGAISVGTFGLRRPLYLNTLYKPDVLFAPAGQPENIPSLTEFSSLYNYARVYACKVRITFSTAATTTYVPVRCFLATITPPNTIPLNSSQAECRNFKNWLFGNPRFGRHRILQSNGNAPATVVLQKYWKMKNLVDNKFEFMSSTLYDTPISQLGPTSDPVNIIPCWYGAVLEQEASPATVINFNVNIQMTLYTRMWGMRVETS